MDKISLGLRSLAQDQNSSINSLRAPEFSSDQARIVTRRASSQVVSLWTCSKVCAISFSVGVVVGFTLKRCLKRWAAKVLKRIKDD